MKSKHSIKTGEQKDIKDQEIDDRKIEIRVKARDIFLRYGYRKTTIEDIGKACGLGKAALYHYFSSKEEIFAEVVRVESESMLRSIREAVDAVDDPRTKIAVMIRTRFKIVGDVVGEFIGNQHHSELAEILPLAAKVCQNHYEQEYTILKRILEEGQRRGIFKKVKLTVVPRIMIAGIRGIEYHFAEIQDKRSLRSLEEAIETMSNLLLEGICK